MDNPIKDVTIIHEYKDNMDHITARLDSSDILDKGALEYLVADMLSRYVVNHNMINLSHHVNEDSSITYVGSLTIVTSNYS